MFWLGQLIRSLEMFFKTVLYERNLKYWLAILVIKALPRIQRIFQGIFIASTKPWSQCPHFNPLVRDLKSRKCLKDITIFL
jgi:hypothetical protein